MLPEEYLRIKNQADTLEREAAELAGARKQWLSELQRELNVKTLKEAKAILKKEERELADLEAELKREEIKFQKEFGEKLQ